MSHESYFSNTPEEHGLTINRTGLHRSTPDPTVPAPDPTEPGHIGFWGVF